MALARGNTVQITRLPLADALVSIGASFPLTRPRR